MKINPNNPGKINETLKALTDKALIFPNELFINLQFRAV